MKQNGRSAALVLTLSVCAFASQSCSTLLIPSAEDSHIEAKGHTPADAVSELLGKMTEVGRHEYVIADQDPSFDISGETNALLSRYEGGLWKMGVGVRWDRKKRAFVADRLPSPDSIPGGLVVFYDPNAHAPESPRWTMIHPGIPDGANPFSNQELNAAFGRIRVTNWTAVYPDGLNKNTEPMNWILSVAYSNGLGHGTHMMYRPILKQD